MNRHARPCDAEALTANLKKFWVDLDEVMAAAARVYQAGFVAFCQFYISRMGDTPE